MPLARLEGAARPRIQGGDDGRQLGLDQDPPDDLVVDGEPVQVVLVEEMPERAMPDIVEEAGHPQGLFDTGRRGRIARNLLQVGIQLPRPLPAEVHRAERVLKTGVFATGKHPPCRLELVNPAQPLQPWMVEQVLLGRAFPVQSLGDLDVPVQRIRPSGSPRRTDGPAHSWNQLILWRRLKARPPRSPTGCDEQPVHEHAAAALKACDTGVACLRRS